VQALSRKLSLRAARRRPGGQPDTAALGGQIGRALRTRGFTSYQGSFDNARRAQDILDTLQELLDVGHQRAGTPAAFPSRLDGLKSRNKRMRNLLAELNRRGL
jgi:hypothetical protein